MIALQNIWDNKKICAHNYSRTAMYFQKFSVVFGHFPKASCGKHFLVTKASFLRKLASNSVFGIISISETNKIKDNTVSIRYISINFGRKIKSKKVIIYLFGGTKHREQETYQTHFTFSLMVASNCYLFYLS